MLMGRFKAVGVLMLAALVLAGCQSTQPQPFADVEEENGATNSPPSETYDPSTEVLQVGEPIIVTFSDLPVVVQPFEERIKADGTITLIHNETFAAAGKSIGQLEKEVRARYVPRFYVNMTVTIKPQENTRFYFVGGEVKQPGRQVYLSRLTVLKAIQSAGDFTDFAKKKKVQLTRANGKTYMVNAEKALKDPALDLEVYPGDKIHVPRRVF
jgi:polysaccharide export outer membrane protein